MGQDQILVDHGPQHVVSQELDLLHLMRGTKTVEEVDEGDPGPQRGGRAHQRQIVSLLHRVRGQ